MKKRVFSILLALALTATLFVGFGTVANAEEYTEYKPWENGALVDYSSTTTASVWVEPDHMGRWNGTTAEWYKQEGQDAYVISFYRWSPYKGQWNGNGYILLKLSGGDVEIIDGSTGSYDFKPSFDPERGLFSVDFSEFIQYDTNCSYSFEIEKPVKETSIFGATRLFYSGSVEGQDLVKGYDGGFWELKGTAYISGTPTGGKEVTAVLLDKSNRKVPKENLRYQWQRSPHDASMWSDVWGADEETYGIPEKDIGYDIRVKVSAKDYYNYAVSEKVTVGKMTTDKKPVVPTIEYKNGNLVVTNAKADQEYIIANNSLTRLELEERWPAYNALETGKDGELTMYGESGKVNYVYTRMRETQTTLPSEAVAWASAYNGQNTLKMTCRTYDPDGGYEISMMENRDTGDLLAYEKYILRLTVEPSATDPSFGGVYGKNFTCKKQGDTAFPMVFYQDKACTKEVNADVRYKDVYVRLPEVTNGLVFSAKDDSSEAEIVLHVGYNDRGSMKIALDSVTVPDITVSQGTVNSDAQMTLEPTSADISGKILIAPVSGGNLPTVDVTLYRNLKVDATKADLGTYVYEIKYIDRNGVNQSMGYFKVNVVKSEIEPEELKLSSNAIMLPVGDFYRLEAVLSPVGAGSNISWETSGSKVAVVNNGAVAATSLDPGDACVITAKTEGGLSDTCTVTITEKETADEGLKNPFVDVGEGDYFYDSVLWAYYAKPQVTNGMDETHFGPDRTVTRGQTVTFLWRAMGEPEPKTKSNPFQDVATTDYYYKAVLWAVEEGITKGTDDTHFTPNQTCSTAHIITFLYRTLGVGSDGWYEEAGRWAEDNGLLKNTGKTVSPEVDCPRCDVVVFLYRTVK